MESVLSTATHFVIEKYKDHGTIISEPVQDERMLITMRNPLSDKIVSIPPPGSVKFSIL